MKKFVILFLLLLPISTFADIETHKYLVKQDDGSVVVVNYIPGSSKSVEDVFRDVGILGKPNKSIGVSDLPARSDRKYWKWNDVGLPIVIDTAKKQVGLDAEAAKEAKRDAVRTKLKITKEDWNDLTTK